MPRSETSAAGRVVAFFRSTELPIAELVLGMCQDAVRERKQKSEKARARATAVPASLGTLAVPPTAGKVKAKKAKAKKSHKKKPPAGVPAASAAEPGLPMDDGVGEEAAGAEEAEDLVVT